MKEILTVGSPFSGAFPTDRFSQVAKDINVHFSIHNFIFRETEISLMQKYL
jgi:hypothetical protein